MDDQIDSDVDDGSVPPTLPNLLTLADQQGDDDEKTIGGLSEGDYDDGDNIGTPFEEKSFSISLKVMLLYHSMDTTSQPYGISPKA